MSTTSSAMSIDQLQQAAKDHLWLHFTRMGGCEAPIIVRGDGCYLEDSEGKRYLDALAGLFAVQIGYSHGDEIGRAAHEQMRELPFYTNWSYAHPRAIELAAEVAPLAPGRPEPRLLRLRRLRGGRVGLEARPRLPRRPRRAPLEGDLPPARLPRHHARRALDQRRRRAAHAVRAARARRRPRPQHEPLPPPAGETEEEFTAFLLDDLESAIVQAGPETVALVIMEPVQNTGGAFTPPAGYFQGVRAICDRYGILLARRRGDHRLRPHRRLVRLRALRHPARPDHVREGPLVRLRLDRRGHRDRRGRRAVPRGRSTLHARHHLRRPSGSVRDRAREHRDHAPRARSSRTSPPTRSASARRSRRSSTSRSPATCAAPATSTRSSSSRTRRPARRSPTRSPRRSCAASSRTGSSRRA